MKILLMTNTFLPIVGGLERSVIAFTKAYRKRGHKVLIVTPEMENVKTDPYGVIRIPALQHFTGSDFSVQLPTPDILTKTLNVFRPDIVHSQHPFLIGDTALRVAKQYNVPLVYTHHTMFEQYLQYVPLGADALKRFVVELSICYANHCHHVFAPSESIRDILVERGVTRPISVVPTGVEIKLFAAGNGPVLRRAHKIPAKAFVVGHTGRLASEKNLEFLARAVASFLKEKKEAHFLVVGKGPSEEGIREVARQAGVAERLHLAGVLKGRRLADAYHAMDVFAFASQSETQGMVLTEAMAAGVPVIAVDAPGVREVVKDKINGRLLAREDLNDFRKALEWYEKLSTRERKEIQKEAKKTAGHFSTEKCAERALSIYERLLLKEFFAGTQEGNLWDAALRRIQAELELLAQVTKAGTAIVTKTDSELRIDDGQKNSSPS